MQPSYRQIKVPDGVKSPEINIITTNKGSELNLWYKRLGHLNYASVKQLNALAEGMNLTSTQLGWKPNGLCEPCELGKSIQRIPGEIQSHAKEPLERLYTDYWGPYQSQGLGGKWYFILVIDEYTH